ncbi:MAG: hypothetical protein RMN52_06025 [Anaerolineae bacterium]|nr:hypothetical protein [Candidatus Roseilinea sp.]MDW8449543.1 hypothetical protein [Anaerolineae bacterium]
MYGFDRPFKLEIAQGHAQWIEWNLEEGFVLLAVESAPDPSTHVVEAARKVAAEVGMGKGSRDTGPQPRVGQDEVMPESFDPIKDRCDPCPRPGEMCIESPTHGQTVSGVIMISGAANHPNFARYKIALGHQDCPDDANNLCVLFESITPNRESPDVPEGILMRWNTARTRTGDLIRNDQYWVVLSVIDKTGNDYPDKACVRVNVSNP